MAVNNSVDKNTAICFFISMCVLGYSVAHAFVYDMYQLVRVEFSGAHDVLSVHVFQSADVLSYLHAALALLLKYDEMSYVDVPDVSFTYRHDVSINTNGPLQLTDVPLGNPSVAVPAVVLMVPRHTTLYVVPLSVNAAMMFAVLNDADGVQMDCPAIVGAPK